MAKHEHIALECSPFLAELKRRNPDWLPALDRAGRLEGSSPPDPKRLAQWIESSGLDTGLRLFRNQEMARIVWRELNRLASVTETLSDLSRLAECCLSAAVDAHTHAMEERFGTPRGPGGEPQKLVVIGMGKLGGSELNMSSDIDIVFNFPHSGECDGPRRLSNEQFFTRLARAVISSLSEVSAAGFCFRVDTRLRPFGESGPLVCSFGAMEQYYQREGRDWERYALIKARPVAGDLEAGDELLKHLSPFVYRRYIDFGAVEALHEMHAAVREDAANRGRHNDVKRGPGGIREIEFLVQAFQLLRGGREPGLQTPSLLKALNTLNKLAILDTSTTQELREDYDFLRRLENAIQALHDQQDHLLPSGPDLERVARAMRCKSGAELQGAFDRVRSRVNDKFNQHFQPQAKGEHSESFRERWRAVRSRPTEAKGTALNRFLGALGRQSMSQRAAQRLDAFMPLLLEQLDQNPVPETIESAVYELVLAICRRSAYLSLLLHNPPALERMIGLFSVSRWIAETVIRHPALLDELIDPTLGHHLPNRAEMTATAARILRSNPDTETALQALNHMKQALCLRVAVAELETTLSPREVQRTLTELAETLVEHCLQIALREVRLKHGDFPGKGLGVIGYGTLGAAELGYASDLDIIFLYASEQGESDGERPLVAERYHTATARRLLGLLTATTTSGRLYDVDTRLRPNGRAGLLVSSLQAFERYQREEAWTWELQALTRARACIGDEDIRARFTAVRQAVLGAVSGKDDLRPEVRRMRQRMREEFAGRDALKHGRGALVDIDFIAQLGVMECAGAHPDILDLTGTFEQVRRLGEIGWLPENRAHILMESYMALTRARHMHVLQGQEPDDLVDTQASWSICAELLEPADE